MNTSRFYLAAFVGSMVSTAPWETFIRAILRLLIRLCVYCSIRQVIYNQMRDYNERQPEDMAIWKFISHQTGTLAARDLLPRAVFGKQH